MNASFKYWAFISYSSRDRAWGEWLIKTIETYKVPKPLVGRATTRDEPVPARIYPVFRDRDELPTDSDLGEMIQQALAQSRYLIVICSPASARSLWVNREILEFKRLGRENRVLAVIIDGEPNATRGPNAAAECFPPALRFKLGADGELSTERTEPIAADARPDRDGRGNALLKLLAGVLGVNYDDLKRRDEERRRRRQRLVIATSAALVLTFATLAGAAAWQWREAERQKREVQGAFSRADFDTSLQRLDDRQDAKAVAFLARALRTDPHNVDAAALLSSVLAGQNWARPESEFRLPQPGLAILGVDHVFQRVLTASPDNVLQMWNRETGQPEGPAMPHPEGIRTALFGAGDHRIVTNCDDDRVRIWNADTGALVATLDSDLFFTLKLSPDGNRFATTSASAIAKVWNVNDGQRIAETTSISDSELLAESGVMNATFSPDGTRIVAMTNGGKSQVFDSTTGKVVSPVLNHDALVRDAQFSPDGRLLVTASADRTAQLWDAQTGAAQGRPLHHELVVWSAAFSPDGKQVATTSWDKTARLWNVADGRSSVPALRLDAEVLAAQFSPDGSRLLTVSSANTVRLWDVASGLPLSAPMKMTEAKAKSFSQDLVRELLGINIGSARFDADGRRVWFITGERIERWDPLGLPSLSHTFAVNPFSSVEASPSGNRIVTTSDNLTAQIWDGATGAALSPVLQQAGDIHRIAFSPDGTRLLTIGDNIQLRNAANGDPIGPPLPRKDASFAAFDRDGSHIITVDQNDDGHEKVGLWSTANGEQVSAPATLGDGEFCVVRGVSSDGRRILSSGTAGKAWVSEVPGGKVLATISTGNDSLETANFSPDGKRVVTASENGVVRVWSADTGQPLTPAMLHAGRAKSAAFSPDGTRLVSASSDKTARIWNAATGAAVGPPLVHAASVDFAAFSADGRRILTHSQDRRARLWDAATSRPVSIWLSSIDQPALSSDGRYVITTPTTQSVRFDPAEYPDTMPAWILDVAEALARCRVDENGTTSDYDGRPVEWLRQQAAQEPIRAHPLVAWAKQILNGAPPGPPAR
ncbi:MAG TPA: TIR domain-containing protein [Opitutaceae bacterium]|nr:TIR domain-containing protein [Opitutaceae bacterium]